LGFSKDLLLDLLKLSADFLEWDLRGPQPPTPFTPMTKGIALNSLDKDERIRGERRLRRREHVWDTHSH
jgi:hypothetical protein